MTFRETLISLSCRGFDFFQDEHSTYPIADCIKAAEVRAKRGLETSYYLYTTLPSIEDDDVELIYNITNQTHPILCGKALKGVPVNENENLASRHDQHQLQYQ